MGRQPTSPLFNSDNLLFVLDIVIVKNFVLLVTMTDSHALSSDYLPVLVDTPCQASVHVPPELSNLKRVHVAKTFYSVWIDDLIYKLIFLELPSYLVKTICLYLTSRTFVASLRNATSSRRFMRAGVPLGGVISPVLFTLYVNDIPTPWRHFELAQYADGTAPVATSGSSKHLVMYLETYLIAPERWLRDWRFATNVDKSMTMLFSPPRRRILNPRGLTFLGAEMQWIDTARYLGVTLDRGLT